MANATNQLHGDPSFLRYYNVWQGNEASFVFVPLAEIYRKNGFLSEAADVCHRGLNHNSGSVSGRFLLARIYVDQKKTREAKTLIAEILHDVPDHEEAKSLLQLIDGPVTPKLSISAPSIAPPGQQGPSAQPVESAPVKSQEQSKAVDSPRKILEGIMGTSMGSSMKAPVEKAPISKGQEWQTITMAEIYAHQNEWRAAADICRTLLQRDPYHAKAQDLLRRCQEKNIVEASP
jgi:predicted Zn-dependent protease